VNDVSVWRAWRASVSHFFAKPAKESWATMVRFRKKKEDVEENETLKLTEDTYNFSAVDAPIFRHPNYSYESHPFRSVLLQDLPVSADKPIFYFATMDLKHEESSESEDDDNMCLLQHDHNQRMNFNIHNNNDDVSTIMSEWMRGELSYSTSDEKYEMSDVSPKDESSTSSSSRSSKEDKEEEKNTAAAGVKSDKQHSYHHDVVSKLSQRSLSTGRYIASDDEDPVQVFEPLQKSRPYTSHGTVPTWAPEWTETQKLLALHQQRSRRAMKEDK
jgi:hypothetical protein